MVSQLSGDLLDLVSVPKSVGRVPRVMSVPETITNFVDFCSNKEKLEVLSPLCHERIIIVANQLPVLAQRDPVSKHWDFSMDEDSLLFQLKDGFSPDKEVIYVGSLKADIDVNNQEEVAQRLLENFRCVPTFLPHDLQKRFYNGFCKQQLWPLFHYMLPIFPDHYDRFNRSLWQAYVSANKKFADKVMEVVNPGKDYVWVHDYHLMVLPTFLRKRFHWLRLGFFLHSPFPSSEIYRTLPVRDEILRSLLNSDLIGFHTFDYARHFLSCCSRILGLNYESKRGYIGLEYYGRTVNIKILPVGIHTGRLESILNSSDTCTKVKEIQEMYKGKVLIIGVDDMDIFKGISLKLHAMGQLLKQQPMLCGKVVLVQIFNPARSMGKDVEEARKEAYSAAERVNKAFGCKGYDPVVLIDHSIPLYERVAFYVAADCCIVNAVRDGMNLIPYEYVVSRQGTVIMDKACRNGIETSRTSMLVVSEFIGCSPSLSGAIRVNPWNIDVVVDALNTAITMPDTEKQLRHEKHYHYVSSHNVGYWAHSFQQDLHRTCKDHFCRRYWGYGFGLSFRVVALSPNFKKLSIENVVSSYANTTRRAIFLDYDGTIMPKTSLSKSPSAEVVSIINGLCNDPRNIVFIITGRGRSCLGEWFAPCELLGVAAEHGFFIRWSMKTNWETCSLAVDVDWKRIVEPIMKSYTEATDGSYIEFKESALVWHHRDADPDFGSCQAKELLDHLENVLANEPVVVKSGHNIVEVKPSCVNKGLVVQKVISKMGDEGKPPDFLLCIGDDRSDEDMFETVLSKCTCQSLLTSPEIFACTIGQKSSKAEYYLDDTVDVIKLLGSLAATSGGEPNQAYVQEELPKSYRSLWNC